MTKKINGLIGFTASDVATEPMKVIAEIETGGTDYNGYKNKETLGLAINQYNDHVLFSGSLDSNIITDVIPTIHFSDNIQLHDMPKLLRTLADKLES